ARLRAMATSQVIGLARAGSKVAALRQTVTYTSCSTSSASLLSFKIRRQTPKSFAEVSWYTIRSAARSPPATRVSAATSWLRVATTSMRQRTVGPRRETGDGGRWMARAFAYCGATVTCESYGAPGPARQGVSSYEIVAFSGNRQACFRDSRA